VAVGDHPPVIILHVVAGQWDGGAISVDETGDPFLHLCTEEQLDGVLDRFSGSTGPITVLEVDSERLGDALVWEPGELGEDFPHLYGSLEPAHVLATRRG
ncbi:MAG: DUF952 domain-containing protein, partial [Acidimicrobiales bacterium]